jgi:hypothetical protein
MALDPSSIAALANVGLQGFGDQMGAYSKSYDSALYYGKFDPAKELYKSVGPLNPGANGEIDLASVYAFKPTDYYGVTGSGKNGNPTMTERYNNATGGEGLSLSNAQSTATNLAMSFFNKPIYNKATKELDAYKKRLSRDAMGYNQGVATRRAYYDKLLEDQSFDYSKFYGNA